MESLPWMPSRSSDSNGREGVAGSGSYALFATSAASRYRRNTIGLEKDADRVRSRRYHLQARQVPALASVLWFVVYDL